MLKQKLNAYIQLTRLNRPIGIYLVLWPALWALWLAAEGMPPIPILLIFIAGAVLMRSAGCIINDYADRHLDGFVERTQSRPLITGLVSIKEALSLALVLSIIAFALVWLLNPLTVILSLGALFLAALYPFMKRYTFWPQAFLGAAFAWAVPMAFAAVLNELPNTLWLVFITTMLWALIYDTAYAVADKEDDKQVGIKSTARLFESRFVPIMASLMAMMVLLLIWMGIVFEMAHFYWLSVATVFIIFFYHLVLLKDQDPILAFKVFLQNHWIGLTVLLGIMLDYWAQAQGWIG